MSHANPNQLQTTQLNPENDAARAAGAVSLYHEASIDPAGRGGVQERDEFGYRMVFDPTAPVREYNRDLDTYVEELGGKFDPQEWVGKKVLDVGGGAYDRFGREARMKGIQVVSINPALREPKHRAYINEALDTDRDIAQRAERRRFAAQPLMRRMFSSAATIPAEKPQSAAALAQNLPFQDESFDAIVSVYGAPHYLHNVDPTLTDDDAILAAYTPEVREQDKALIQSAFDEMVRVLKPGGKAFLTDSHSTPGQKTEINKFSPSDGSEVVEALDELKSQGVTYQITEQSMGEDAGVTRIIVIQKPLTKLPS